MTRVLLTDATSYKAAVVARFLHAAYPAVEVVTCDGRATSRWCVTKYRKRHHVLRRRAEDGRAYVEALRDLARAESIDVLLPVHSSEMGLLLASREEFGAALSYWGEYESFRTLDEKDRSAALARTCGVPTPEEFPTLAAAHPPVVAKPVRSSAARGVRYLRDEAQVRAFRVPSDCEYLFQSYVPGTGIGYSVFARDGRILQGFGHRRLAEFPTSGGSSVYREGFEPPGVVDAVRRLVEATRWSGFAMFEFKHTGDGRLFLLEVNPRIWGSIHQGLAAGVNFFEPLLGPAAPFGDPQTRTYLSPVAYLSFAGYLARGRAGPLLAFLRHWRRNRADVPLRDPGAWLGSLLRLA